MNDYRSIVPKLAGPLVPIIPAFDSDYGLDIDSTCKWVARLVDRGIKLFWTTYGTTHFMCLTDAEIRDLTKALAGVTRGKAIFIASTPYHWPVPIIRAFLAEARQWGVDSVKVQVDWRMFQPTDEQLLDHYERVSKDSPLPLIAYTWGTPGVKYPVFRKILDMPAFVGMKNDTGDFYEHARYLATVREAGVPFAVMTGGTMESFLHGRQFGATAYAVGTGIFAPQVPLKFQAAIEAGRREEAIEIVRTIEQPITWAFAAMGHWACFHAAVHLQGLFASPAMRFPLRTLGGEDIQRVGDLLRKHGMIE